MAQPVDRETVPAADASVKEEYEIMLMPLAFLAAALLAFANGANDNFKGVATLFGSGTTSFYRALAWATVTTFGGSFAAVYLGADLLTRFSGKGLVADVALTDPRFAVGVVTAAGLTVLTATRLGFPISTTHALVGAMAGTSIASTADVSWEILGKTFLLPLVVSPVVALMLTAVVYLALRGMRGTLGIPRRSCICVGEIARECIPVAVMQSTASMAFAPLLSPKVAVTIGSDPACRESFTARMLGVEAEPTLDVLHFVSAGVVSFARGLNDTPKIAALLFLTSSFSAPTAVIFCGGAIALGGLVAARRVAETMSHRITAMNAGQGFTANLVTGFLVICATRWGMPVSTTHVSCGALFGIGFMNGQARTRLIVQVLLAWIATLPFAFLLGLAIHPLLTALPNFP